MRHDHSKTKLIIYALVGCSALIIFLLIKIYLLKNPDSSVLLDSKNANLWIIFITGLTIGGLTCLAVQGGLLASVIAVGESDETKKHKFHGAIATSAFLISKLAMYTVLGFILGAFGGVLNISPAVQVYMQIIAGVYMLIVALNLLEVHPIFRYAIVQPPRFLTRMIRNRSKSTDLFAPALLGALTIFIPCGTTLAMEALAISSGSAIMGATTMFAFILGTIPVFFGVGWLTSILGDTYKKNFLKLAALALLYLGVTSIIGGFQVSGFSLSGLKSSPPVQVSQYNGPAQEVTINITASGYSPSTITAKQGIPIKLTLNSNNAFNCASAFRIPSLGVAVNLQPTQTEVIELPDQSVGQIAFSCSMGMYRGFITII